MGTLAKYSIALIAYAAGGLSNVWLVTNGWPQSMVARWLVAFAVGYLVFVLLVRLYCYANSPVRRFRERRSWVDGGDVLDVGVRVTRGCSRSSDASLGHGGGQFGGGGASSSFSTPLSPEPFSPSSGLSNLTFDIPVVDEGAGIVIGIVIAVALVGLALGLGASLLYVLWQMPELLADAVAGAAVVGLASNRAESWWGALTRHTWKPVLVSLLSLVVTGMVLHLAAPQAHTLGDVVAALRHGEVHPVTSKDDGATTRRQPLRHDRERTAS